MKKQILNIIMYFFNQNLLYDIGELVTTIDIEFSKMLFGLCKGVKTLAVAID